MNGVLRTWQCQNQRCGACFDAWEAFPTCSKCGNVRVEWVPRGGNVFTEAARNADTELRKLADSYGMTDINSAHRGERAKPKLAPSRAARGDQTNFGGFMASIDPQGAQHAQNQSGAQCVPASNISFKTRVGTGSKLAPSKTYPGVGTNTVIEARHGGR